MTYLTLFFTALIAAIGMSTRFGNHRWLGFWYVAALQIVPIGLFAANLWLGLSLRSAAWGLLVLALAGGLAGLVKRRDGLRQLAGHPLIWLPIAYTLGAVAYPSLEYGFQAWEEIGWAIGAKQIVALDQLAPQVRYDDWLPGHFLFLAYPYLLSGSAFKLGPALFLGLFSGLGVLAASYDLARNWLSSLDPAASRLAWGAPLLLGVSFHYLYPQSLIPEFVLSYWFLTLLLLLVALPLMDFDWYGRGLMVALILVGSYLFKVATITWFPTIALALIMAGRWQERDFWYFWKWPLTAEGRRLIYVQLIWLVPWVLVKWTWDNEVRGIKGYLGRRDPMLVFERFDILEDLLGVFNHNWWHMPSSIAWPVIALIALILVLFRSRLYWWVPLGLLGNFAIYTFGLWVNYLYYAPSYLESVGRYYSAVILPYVAFGTLLFAGLVLWPFLKLELGRRFWVSLSLPVLLVFGVYGSIELKHQHFDRIHDLAPDLNVSISKNLNRILEQLPGESHQVGIVYQGVRKLPSEYAKYYAVQGGGFGYTIHAPKWAPENPTIAEQRQHLLSFQVLWVEASDPWFAKLVEPLKDPETCKGPLSQYLMVNDQGTLRCVYKVPLTTCQDLLDQGMDKSGAAQLSVGDQSIDTYCDQKTDGGGWTLLAVISASDRKHVQADRYNEDRLSDLQPGKLSDHTIRLMLRDGEYRFECGDRKVFIREYLWHSDRNPITPYRFSFDFQQWLEGQTRGAGPWGGWDNYNWAVNHDYSKFLAYNSGTPGCEPDQSSGKLWVR